MFKGMIDYPYKSSWDITTGDINTSLWNYGTATANKISDYGTYVNDLVWRGNNTAESVSATPKKEDKDNDMFNFNNMFDGMFKAVSNGCCKMSMDGQIAVKTSTGYKTFDIKKNRLVNCDNFAFDMNGMFWVVPTFKVSKGDIIMVNGKPRAVIEVKDSYIETFSYEDSTIDKVVPEYHTFLGKTYCYGKIVSPIASMTKSDEGMGSLMKMMMFSQMFGNNNGNNSSTNGFNPMMFMLMGKDFSMSDMFGDMFNFGPVEAPKEDK